MGLLSKIKHLIKPELIDNHEINSMGMGDKK